MSHAIIPPAKRSRGRPRKSATLGFPSIQNYTPPSYALKRKLPDASSEEIEIVGYNGFGEEHCKKSKALNDFNQPKRLLPPRRARFTESYEGTSAEVVTLTDDDNDSDSESDDSECGPMPSPPPQTKTAEELKEWEEEIEKLKKSLSDEEMKLVLLRKLKDSQICKDPKRETCDSPAPVNIAQKPLALTHKSGIQIQPLPSKQLMKSNKYMPSRKEQKVEKPSQNQSTCLSIQKQSSPSLFKPVHPPNKVEIKKDSPVNTPKYVPEQINSNHLHQYPLLKSLSNQITITAVPPVTSSSTSNNSPSTSSNSSINNISKHEERIDAETLQQRQAAAKLALRKQLEKTLLQIPLPKPPPLKINFFPNPNSIEFLCLIGLDFVVDFLTKSKKNTPLKDPLKCAQCSTDFTCAWKWKEVDRNGKKAYDVFCEACITSNIRKALKAQHTNNLKSAFLKALQQEKEIDRLSHTMPKAHSSSNKELPRSTPRLPMPSPAHQPKSSSTFTIPKPTSSLPYIPKTPPILSPAAALAAQVSKLSPQYQSLLQAQAQQLLAAGVPLHPSMLSLSPFVTPPMNHSRGKSSMGQNNNSMRRQYRTDRVQSPSIPQPKSSWKA